MFLQTMLSWVGWVVELPRQRASPAALLMHHLTCMHVADAVHDVQRLQAAY
jgi:hypothetical protein